jgi:hypothetical protein
VVTGVLHTWPNHAHQLGSLFNPEAVGDSVSIVAICLFVISIGFFFVKPGNFTAAWVILKIHLEKCFV